MDHKKLLELLWFSLKDNAIWVYFKKYHDNSIIEVDCQKEDIRYLSIECESKTTSNFSQPENFVVLECVDRLLDKWYYAKDIVLEKTYKLGHINKWRLDILVKKEWKTFLMIECKTWGKEFEKELKNIQKDGGQIFSYFQQDRDAEFIMLYTSHFDSKIIEYKNEIIKIEESYRETSNVKDFFDRWNKFTKKNGIFEDWVNTYDFESRALTYDKLEDIKESDASFIFNRFLEILRHNTVSDKPNAFNKMFTLFLCKIYDEIDKNWTNKELDFQWKEWIDNPVIFQKRLSDLYKKWMSDLLSKEITDFSDKEFEDQFWSYISDEQVKQKLLEKFTKIRLQKNNEFAIKEVFDEETFDENAKVLKEVVELLQNYRFRYAKKQPFLWDFFELLLTTWLKQEAGQFFTPVPIARFICRSIPMEQIIDEKIKLWNANDILPKTIDYAAWSGHFIIESMEEIQKIIKKKDVSNQWLKIKDIFKKYIDNPYDWAWNYTYGIEKDYRLVRTSKVGCYLHGDGIATVIHWDGLDSFENSKTYKWDLSECDKDDKQYNWRFDLVLSNPPYSVSAFKWNLKREDAENDFDLYKSLTDNSSEIEALFIERTSQLLKEGGIAWIILPSSILSNTGIYTKAREIILKNFEIISVVSLGSNTFMATWTNTVVLFMRRRNKFFAQNIEKQVDDLYKNLLDVSLHTIEHVFSKYIHYVWEWISFEDYKTLILKNPNEKILNHEIYKEYSKKLKLAKNADLYDKIIQIEKEKMLYFVLSYNQNIVLVKSWEKQAEKELLGYEFSFRKWSEGIHPIQGWKLIDECTKLFDPESLDNPEKVSTYIYDGFNDDFTREISENLSEHVFRTKLVDLLTFDRVEFEKTVSTNSKKKNSIWKYPNIKLWEICEVKIWWTPDRSNYEYWENWTNTWVSISEMNWNIITETKENITDAWVKKSNVKLINTWTTLLSFKLSIWKTAIAWKSLYTNEAIAWLCLENEEKVLNKYLFDLFNSKFIDLEKWWFNTFWKSLNSEFLRNEVKIPLPPLDIQQKIVSEIEVLEKEEQEKKEKVEVLKSEVERIVWWIEGEKIKLGDISENLDSLRKPVTKSYREKWNIPYYGASGIVDYVSEFIIDDYVLLVAEDGANLKSRSTPIAFTSDGKARVNNHAHILKFPNTTTHKLIELYLNKADISQYITGQAQPKLNQENLNNIVIPLPPLGAQQKIVSQIEKIESEIGILESDLKAIPKKKQEVLNKYL